MTRPLLLLAAIFTLAAGTCVAGSFVLPALAQPQITGDPTVGQPQIDLEAIPVQPVKGPLSVKGVAGDDDHDSLREAEASEHAGKGDRADRGEDDEDE